MRESDCYDNMSWQRIWRTSMHFTFTLYFFSTLGVFLTEDADTASIIFHFQFPDQCHERSF